MTSYPSFARDKQILITRKRRLYRMSERMKFLVVLAVMIIQGSPVFTQDITPSGRQNVQEGSNIVFNCTIEPRQTFAVRVNNTPIDLRGEGIPLGNRFTYGPVYRNQSGERIQCEIALTSQLSGVLELNVLWNARIHPPKRVFTNFSGLIGQNLTVTYNISDRGNPPIPEPSWTFQGGTPSNLTNSTFPNVMIIFGDNGGLQFTNITEEQQGLYTATFGNGTRSPTFIIELGISERMPEDDPTILPTGAIVGIAIGGVVLVILPIAITAIVCVVVAKKKS